VSRRGIGQCGRVTSKLLVVESNDAAIEGSLLCTRSIGDYDELPNNKVSEPKGALVHAVWGCTRS